VVEIGNAVGQLDRVVIRKKMTERTETDSLRSGECLCNQQVGCRTRLPGSGEVFPDPGLLEAKLIQALEILEIPELSDSDAPLGRMRRHQERAELQLTQTPHSLQILLPCNALFGCKSRATNWDFREPVAK
jgi:hypothetical protein